MLRMTYRTYWISHARQGGGLEEWEATSSETCIIFLERLVDFTKATVSRVSLVLLLTLHVPPPLQARALPDPTMHIASDTAFHAI